MSTYNLRTRRTSTSEPTEPMSGAGYDIVEEERQQEDRWAKLEHAVHLSLNYFKRNPVSAEHVRAFVLMRAKQNYKRTGGDENDYTVNLYVNSLPHDAFAECVCEPEPIVEPSVDSEEELATEEESSISTSPIATATGAAAGGGGGREGSKVYYTGIGSGKRQFFTPRSFRAMIAKSDELQTIIHHHSPDH